MSGSFEESKIIPKEKRLPSETRTGTKSTSGNRLQKQSKNYKSISGIVHHYESILSKLEH